MSNGVTIAAFLDAVAEDPELEFRFSENPIQVMKEFGLSKQQRGTILGGTAGEIRAAIQDEQPSAQARVFVIKMK